MTTLFNQNMMLPSGGLVDVARLSGVCDNTVATYKFYRFVSIIDWFCANPGRRNITFDESFPGIRTSPCGIW